MEEKIPLVIDDINDINDNISITFCTIQENIGKNDAIINNFLSKQALITLIIKHKEFSFSEKEKDLLFKKTRDLIFKELTRRWYKISIHDVNECDFLLIKTFLETTDYSHSNVTKKQKEDLEEFLAKMLYYYVKRNPVSSESFVMLFDLLDHYSITTKTLIKLIKLSTCQTARAIIPQLSHKLLDILLI